MRLRHSGYLTKLRAVELHEKEPLELLVLLKFDSEEAAAWVWDCS
jgi:hypothetical protein